MDPGFREPRLDRAGPRLRVADRVARGQRDPAHDPVRDGRLAGRRPHHALLPAQREVAERVPLALPLQECPQLLLVVLGERVDGAPGAERGVEDGEDQEGAEDVDGDVGPVRGPDAGEAILRGGDGDQPERAVAPALHERRTGRVLRLVGDRHQQPGEQRGGQGPDDRDDGGEAGVGPVALRVELPASHEQRTDEGRGQHEGDPVLRVPADLRERHREPEQREEQPADHQVQDPRGPFAAPHGDGEERREHPGREACRQQIRGEEVLLVVPSHVLPQRHPRRAEEVDERHGPQIPDSKGRGPPRGPEL